MSTSSDASPSDALRSAEVSVGDGSGVQLSRRVERGATRDANREVLARLRSVAPDAPFLTLGQTVFWDEPIKAAFRALVRDLESHESGEAGPKVSYGARFVAGVHDTDYFAKLDGVTIRDEPFVVLRHNDGDTRGLWSAAGELSALFGAEVVPPHTELWRDGVRLRQAARAYPGGLEALLNQETDAPGWRALVDTRPSAGIAADVRLSEILPALRQQLRWGFRQSLATTLCSPDFENDEPCPSREVARRVLGWVEGFARAHRDATLSDLYRDLVPRFWALLGGEQMSAGLEVTSSLELFEFSPLTCARPRFAVLDFFVNPATRAAARAAYDDAVRGSGIYTLDGFGPGALPFDVVVPGQGRGTLRLHEDSIWVDTPVPTQICAGCDPGNVARLAALLEGHYGPGVRVVGKAVTLISMLAAEFVFVFHETASSYTRRTRELNTGLRRAGFETGLFPLVRVRLETWDALAGIDAEFALPDHLARVCERERISAQEFGAHWREMVARQERVLGELASLSSPSALLAYLCDDEARRAARGERRSFWRDKAQNFFEARSTIADLRARLNEEGARIALERDLARAATREASRLERDRGAFFRACVLPLQRALNAERSAAFEASLVPPAPGQTREQKRVARESALGAERELSARLGEIEASLEAVRPRWQAFLPLIEAHRVRARAHRARANQALEARRALERAPEVEVARAQLSALSAQLELERFFRVRDARRAIGALRATNARPTAWWLPMVSPNGHWFEAIAASLSVRLEEI